MTYAQIVDKRNKLMAEATTLSQSKNPTSETRSKVTTMLAEADDLSQDAQNAKTLETHAEEIRSAGRPNRGDLGTAPDESAQSKLALRDWMRSGSIAPEHRSILREFRDLGSATGVGIGTNTITSSVMVPVGFDPQLAVAAKSYGQLYNSVRHLTTSNGEPLKVALADDTEQGLTLLATEITAVTETDPNLAGFMSNVDDVTTGLVKVSNNLLNDSAFSVDDFITTTFGSRFYKGMNQFIQLGNGSHVAAIGANVPVGATTVSPTAIALADIINCFAALDPAYLDNASWVFSPAVKAYLMTLVDSFGRPLIQSVSDAPFSTLYGRPIVSSTFAAGIGAGNIVALFGDLTSYTARQVNGLQIVRLNERYAEFNEVGFIGRARVGGYSTLQTASPAIVSLRMHA